MTDHEKKVFFLKSNQKEQQRKYAGEKKIELKMLHSHLEIPVRFLEVPNNDRSSFARLGQHLVL